MITKLTNTEFTIICIIINHKLHVLLYACILKPDMKSIDPHTPSRFLKTPGNVWTP